MDLTSSYAGIQVGSPFVIGASPLALDTDRIKEFVEHGVGAVVMPSIFEEQITKSQLEQSIPVSPGHSHEKTYDRLPKSAPDLDAYNGGAEGYLRYIKEAKSAVEIPIIASVNGMTTGPWMRYAKELESAGADAIELNLYHYEVNPHRFAEDIEEELVNRISSFCAGTRLPVAIKLLPQFTCLPNMAYRIAGAGAKSLCLFGKGPSFQIQESGQIGYRWHLTLKADLRVSLEGIRQVHGAVHNLTIAASGGIQTSQDALAAFQMGADVVMMTSAIYQQGSSLVQKIRDALIAELRKREMLSLQDLIGSQSSGFNPFPEAARRQEYSSSIAGFSADDIESKDD